MGDAFGEPAFAVDTHVERVSKRLRICKLNANVTEVEQTLMRKVPKELWVKTHHTMIFFGRYHCLARAPKCEACPLLYMCQEGKERMKGNNIFFKSEPQVQPTCGSLLIFKKRNK